MLEDSHTYLGSIEVEKSHGKRPGQMTTGETAYRIHLPVIFLQPSLLRLHETVLVYYCGEQVARA